MRRRWRVLLALVLGLALAVAALWSQRRSIARGFVDDALAERGVPARYTIEDIGFRRQRLTNVVIGDPARPDLIADRVDVDVSVGLGGASVTGLSVGRVRMRGRIVDGQVRLGAIDRLLGPPSGRPFALPRIDATIDDLRLRLDTPGGPVGLKIGGAGRLDDGFAGRVAAVAPTYGAGACRATNVRAALSVRVALARPSVEGPVRAARVDCGEFAAEALALDVAAGFAPALDRWTGRSRIAAGRVAGAGVAAAPMLGAVTFDGTARATAGTARLRAVSVAHAAATGGAVTLAGRYRTGTAGTQFAGDVAAEHVALSPAWRDRIAALDAAGTPVAPLARAVGAAAARAAADVAVGARVEAVAGADGAAVRVATLAARSASGAVAELGGAAIRLGAVELGGTMRLRGGGLPEAAVAVRREGAGFAGTARVAPYAAGDARLALAPVTFAIADGAVTRVATTATLSGPVGDGRVDELVVPVVARRVGRGVAVNRGCTPVAWRRLAVAGLVLDPARLTLCPTGAALLTVAGGTVDGGARLAESRIAGTLGGSPVAVSAAGSELSLGERGFSLTDVTALLGSPGRATRIAAARIAGRIAGGGVAGCFAGLGGQVANVPLLLDGAGGDWSLVGGRLALRGATLGVRDAQVEAPRFVPLVSDDVALLLDGGRITATATLLQPRTRTRIVDVRIVHALGAGAGSATLDVPGITFGDALQPNDVTPLTFGVIADVRGTVAGAGRIDWGADGVRSTGRFGTRALDLAAAFGPVTGIAGEIVFTDLLGLVSAPDQRATVATVNPGIAVENGEVTYRLIGDNRVAVTGARWPFAGGALTLDPTTLDFGSGSERRMTFRVARADAAAFLQQFDFDNVNATGTFDGVLPMVFDENGGRLVEGHLHSRTGGTLAYVGAVSRERLGFWGDLAFGALRSLRYRAVDITLNGPLAGDMVTAIRFDGVSQGEGARSNFLIRRLARLPFVFNITIRAPFRQLLDSVRSYYDPSRLIERNLPALLEQRRQATPPVQPPESETPP